MRGHGNHRQGLPAILGAQRTGELQAVFTTFEREIHQHHANALAITLQATPQLVSRAGKQHLVAPAEQHAHESLGLGIVFDDQYAGSSGRLRGRVHAELRLVIGCGFGAVASASGK